MQKKNLAIFQTLPRILSRTRCKVESGIVNIIKFHNSNSIVTQSKTPDIIYNICPGGFNRLITFWVIKVFF